VSFMGYEIQTNAIFPYFLFSLAYLCILCFAKAKRDIFGLALIVGFCVMLGLRDVKNMSVDADPVLYATILSYSGDIQDLAGGADYAIFSLLHLITEGMFNLSECFFLLHLIYIPALYLLFRCLKNIKGVFFLLVGWMLFVNSGILLLANFFRQGISTIIFLSVLVGLCSSNGKQRLSKIGVLGLPFLHLASLVLVPSLFTCRKRYYYFISCASFVILCAAVHFVPAHFVSISSYFDFEDLSRKILWVQLCAKIFVIYLMLGIGYFVIRLANGAPAEVKNIQRAAIGLLIPTGALLLTSNAPIIGLRYLYYSYALVFLYLFCVLSCRKNDLLIKLSAIGLCLVGIVTWTYPTVAVLLIW
jgi:hypothetical protein